MQRFVAPWVVSLSIAVASPAVAVSFDHLDCRRVRDGLGRDHVRAEMLARDPILTPRGRCTLTLPARYLCTASAVVGFDPPPPGGAAGPDAHGFVCYRARCRHDRPQVDVRDAFGDRTVAVKGTRLVCLPLASPEGTTTTTVTSTTLPPTSTTSTTPPSTSSTITTTSSTTSSTSSTLPTTTSSIATTTSSTSTTSTTLAGPVPPSAGCPVVNEVMTGSDASASEELIEILNPCAAALDLAGARILYQSASGATQRTLVTWDPGTALAAGGRLLYATSQYAGPADGSFASGLSGSGGGVGVEDAGGTLVDGVGWGTATNGLVEGSVAPAPAPGSAIARIPDGVDTDDGASDWRETAPTPGGPNA